MKNEDYTLFPIPTRLLDLMGIDTSAALRVAVDADGKLTVDERPVYTVKATAGSHGSITPSGDVDVLHGGSQTFTIAANSGYAISNVKIDGVSIGAVKSYTFENVTENHTIEVTFMKANGNPQTGVMVDEVTGEYYVA